MSKTDILEWFSLNTEELQTDKILFVMAMSLFIGAIIFITYRLTYRGVAYNAKFNTGNVVLVLISATIMLMISSNIAISLGMVGALSIVRFRTAIKDPQDTIYIFWAIIEGLCVGAQVYKLAVIADIVIALLLICSSFYSVRRNKYLIVVRGTGSLQPEAVLACIKEYNRKTRLRSMNIETDHAEIIAEVTSSDIPAKLLETLQALPNVTGVNSLLEMGEYIG